nr:MAG TPA: hypothetical protein [Caudoviricetes sp.]
MSRKKGEGKEIKNLRSATDTERRRNGKQS